MLIKQLANILKLLLLYFLFIIIYTNLNKLFHISLIYETQNEVNLITCIIALLVFSILFFMVNIENTSIIIFNILIFIEICIIIIGYDYVISNFYQSTYCGIIPINIIDITYMLLSPFSFIISIPIVYNFKTIFLLIIPIYFIIISYLKIKKSKTH